MFVLKVTGVQLLTGSSACAKKAAGVYLLQYWGIKVLLSPDIYAVRKRITWQAFSWSVCVFITAVPITKLFSWWTKKQEVDVDPEACVKRDLVVSKETYFM